MAQSWLVFFIAGAVLIIAAVYTGDVCLHVVVGHKAGGLGFSCEWCLRPQPRGQAGRGPPSRFPSGGPIGSRPFSYLSQPLEYRGPRSINACRDCTSIPTAAALKGPL